MQKPYINHAHSRSRSQLKVMGLSCGDIAVLWATFTFCISCNFSQSSIFRQHLNIKMYFEKYAKICYLYIFRLSRAAERRFVYIWYFMRLFFRNVMGEEMS